MLLALVLAQFYWPPVDGQGIYAMGRRFVGDPAADIIVSGSRFREGAYVFGVWQPSPCNFQTWGVAMNGDVHFGQALTPWCTSDPSGGTLVDISGVSGHTSLTVSDRFYLYTAGALGAHEDAFMPNGERPVCGVDSHTRMTDAGCVYNYAGQHGDHTFGSRFPMRSGVLMQLYNPVRGDRTDYVAEWDYNGAFSQNHGLTRAQFPSPVQQPVLTSLGWFFYEAAPGALMWARDTEHWYLASPTKAQWRQIAEQPDVDELAARVVSLEARIAALEAACP